jgi:hypothetical protein
LLPSHGQQQCASAAGSALGAALQPTCGGNAVQDLTLVRLDGLPFELAHSVAGETFVEQMHGELS